MAITVCITIVIKLSAIWTKVSNKNSLTTSVATIEASKYRTAIRA